MKGNNHVSQSNQHAHPNFESALDAFGAIPPRLHAGSNAKKAAAAQPQPSFAVAFDKF